MDEYRNTLIQIFDSAKEQLSEEEYKELIDFVRKVVKEPFNEENTYKLKCISNLFMVVIGSFVCSI